MSLNLNLLDTMWCVITEDYLWLRSLENRMQMIDQQTHTLPDQAIKQE